MNHARALAFITTREQHITRLHKNAAEYRAAGRPDTAKALDHLAAWLFAQAVRMSLALHHRAHAETTPGHTDPHSHGVTLPTGHFVPTRPYARTAALTLNGQRVRRISVHGSHSAQYVAAVIHKATQTA